MLVSGIAQSWLLAAKLVDMIYFAKQVKRDVEKTFALRWEP